MATYVLSVPPSANHMFGQRGRVRFKSKKYKTWIDAELKSLIAQRAKPVLYPCTVSITLPITTRGDCDNRIKPTIDLLVRAGILEDDSRKFVQGVSVTFGKVDMMHVTLNALLAA